MRRSFLLTIALVALSGLIGAQYSGLGFKAALVLSNTKSATTTTNLIPNASAGLYFPLRAGERFEVQPELLITSLGAGYTLPDGDRSTVRALYVQLPVSAKVYFGNVMNVQAGLQAGRLILAQQSTPEGTADVTSSYETWDYGVVIGAGADLVTGLDLGFRYYSGLKPSLAVDTDLYPRNRAFMISAGYRIARLRPVSFTRRRG